MLKVGGRTMKKLSLVIATRNDLYNSTHTTPLFRLQTSLKVTLHNAGDANLEIIIVDYGSDEKLEDNLGIDDARLKFIYIDKEECKKYDAPFNEVLCINRGAKNATGDFIGRIDQDTIVGKRFFDWYFQNEIPNGKFYFSGRRELENGEYTENDNAFYWWGGNPGQKRNYWMRAVGVLLIPRKYYIESHGYNETNIHQNYMEHEFISRLRMKLELINLGKILNVPFYHIYHDRVDADSRKRNPKNGNHDTNFTVNLNKWG
jgi:hypothetical protein